MIISHRKQFIFVHTYKVAGTSVKTALKPHADILYSRYSLHRLLYVLGFANPPGDHLSAREIQQRVGKETFDRYFSFAFVRNPWDWQVSLYHYILSRPLHPQHRLIKSMSSFPDYLEWRINEGVELQRDFVADENGAIMLDFIGRYETLSSDFNHACQCIGIDAELPHRNASTHKDYRRYYDDYTAALVAEHYRPDIEIFNYRFDP